MARYQITCVTKGNYSHEAITQVGGSFGLKSRQQVINDINAGDTYYIIDPNTGRTSTVGPWPNSTTGPYLRSYADGDYNNNLLSLPSC